MSIDNNARSLWANQPQDTGCLAETEEGLYFLPVGIFSNLKIMPAEHCLYWRSDAPSISQIASICVFKKNQYPRSIKLVLYPSQPMLQLREQQ